MLILEPPHFLWIQQPCGSIPLQNEKITLRRDTGHGQPNTIKSQPKENHLNKIFVEQENWICPSRLLFKRVINSEKNSPSFFLVSSSSYYERTVDKPSNNPSEKNRMRKNGNFPTHKQHISQPKTTKLSEKLYSPEMPLPSETEKGVAIRKRKLLGTYTLPLAKKKCSTPAATLDLSSFSHELNYFSRHDPRSGKLASFAN